MCLRMTLRVLDHGLFARSYNKQLIDIVDSCLLEDILHDLQCNVHTIYGESTKKIHTQITPVAWTALAHKVFCKLDGILARKTAEECRLAFDLILLYCHIDSIDDIGFIYGKLQDHFKCTRRPMPSLHFVD